MSDHRLFLADVLEGFHVGPSNDAVVWRDNLGIVQGFLLDSHLRFGGLKGRLRVRDLLLGHRTAFRRLLHPIELGLGPVPLGRCRVKVVLVIPGIEAGDHLPLLHLVTDEHGAFDDFAWHFEG